MDEYTSPSLVTIEDHENLNTLLADRVRRAPDKPLFERKDDAGNWQSVTAGEFAAEVARIAKGLINSGVGLGHRVGIMSRTSYAWSVLDFAVAAAGGISVPLYETSSADQVSWIVEDSGLHLLVVENSEHRKVALAVKQKLPSLVEVLTLEDGALATLAERGKEVGDAELQGRSSHAKASDPATIIYTSGTTGRPKGALLSHRNFVELTKQAVAGLSEIVQAPGSRTLLFMPMAHVFARFVAVLVVPASEAVLGHCSDTKTLLADLGTFRPTFILSVPRVFEKVYNSSEQKAADGGKLKIFRWAAATGIGYSRALDKPSGPSLGLKIQHKLADALVLKKLRAALGGQTKWAISGGAPLGERLGHFYRGLGLNVLEGYGLTETTAPTSVNRPGAVKIGSVGLAMPGTSVRIDEDGEILLKGNHVFSGYWQNDAATAEAFTGDWFRSGDLGRIDEDGYLYITGRKKEIIVTAGGKNVAPAVLEDRLRGHPLVSQCVVVGDQKPFIGALVTLDPEGLPGWLRTKGLPEMDITAAAEHPAVIASLAKGIKRTNRVVSRAESIRKFKVLTTDFTVENNYLTPSLKVKRSLVLRDFDQQIESLYQGEGHDVANGERAD